MKCSFSVACLLLSAILSNVGSAQSEPDVVEAFNSGFESQEDFETVFSFVRPRESESQWRRVKWMPGLWAGMQAASKLKKPMFIWAMNGDPLGCV